MRRLLGVALGMMIGLANQAGAIPTLMVGSSLFTEASDGVGSIPSDARHPILLPFDPTSTVLDGGSTNATTYSLTTDSFDFRFDHVRDGNAFSYAYSSGRLDFTVSHETHYEFSGAYTATGNKRLLYSAYLADRTTPTTLFRNHQESRTTLNESFTLGGTGGDFSNVLLGSQTGTFVPGHTYRLSYDVLLQTFPDLADSGASAVGDFRLLLTPVQTPAPDPVPEPGTWMLMGTGLVGLILYGWRKKKQTA